MPKHILYANDIHVDDWASDLALTFFEREAHGIPKIFAGVPMLRGRGRWLTALPPCVFRPDLTVFPSGIERDLVRVALAVRREARLGFFKPSKEITVREGRGFYSTSFLREMGPLLALPATVAAFASFLHAVNEGRVQVGKTPQAERPPSQARQGWARRWLPQEDAVIRSWFGLRAFGEHEGRHAPLTDREWSIVLQDHLHGRRTKKQVKVRISALNRELRVSLLVDGFLPRDKVREFQDRALGEQRIRVPRFRPRIKGRSYRGDRERPVLGQPY
jgi:hypothetical protein